MTRRRRRIPSWTPATDAALRRLYLVMPVSLIAAALNLSPASIYRRFVELKLAQSSPLETLPDAARRTGLTMARLLTVLNSAGVVIHSSIPVKRQGRTRFALRAEIDQAVMCWREMGRAA
ncbi:MAG TPA: hypothetical protein VM686_00410 [Polyangiaceae bacterium]|nr:hypothetical protein [Polyangiaceae bacterium]